MFAYKIGTNIVYWYSHYRCLTGRHCLNCVCNFHLMSRLRILKIILILLPNSSVGRAIGLGPMCRRFDSRSKTRLERVKFIGFLKKDNHSAAKEEYLGKLLCSITILLCSVRIPLFNSCFVRIESFEYNTTLNRLS